MASSPLPPPSLSQHPPSLISLPSDPAAMTAAEAAPSKKPKKKKNPKKPHLNGIDTSAPSISNDPKPTSAAGSSSSGKIPPSPAMSSASSKSKDGNAGSLIICRNKYSSMSPVLQVFLGFLFSPGHWRYISSFHGPWLQLPPEVLESLAYHNWGTPRPHPIDPAVFFDIVKIRRLVDEATTISVRAASGVASSSSSYNSSAASLMGGGNAAILGIGFANPNSNAKLSRERKHRMRELATQKLSKAYALDEIAASVATMQGASTLEDVASFVLQRNPNDVDAKYVHFFHEKIPSRMLAASTSLDPLDQVIFERPYDGWALRTRAVTKGFKDDHLGAAADLTSALKKVRNAVHDGGLGVGSTIGDIFGANGGASSPGGGSGIHSNRSGSRGTGSGSGGGPGTGGRDGANRDESLQPSSLEMQLLFHRASTYLTIACQKIETFNALGEHKSAPATTANGTPTATNGNGAGLDIHTVTAAKREMIRKAIRANSKKAIRDYLKYLSYFDYTPGLTPEEAEEQLRQNIQAATRMKNQKALEYDGPTNGTANSNAGGKDHPTNGSYSRARIPAPRGPVYPVSTLFTSPPSTLPPYPVQSTELTKYTAQPPSPPPSQTSMLPVYEQITYHPLLTDALHSLLLCHAIISTPPKEIQRYAFMVARLARICDGYPIFLAARSPARADWIELIRRVGDWISLGRTWESLCQPAPLPPVFEREEGPMAAHQQQSHGGGRGLIGDGNVSSDALSALMSSGGDDGLDFAGVGGGIMGAQREHSQVRGAKRWAQEDGKEYPISTERAAVIARFVKEEMKRGKEAAEKAASSAAAASAAAEKMNDSGEKVGLRLVKEESFDAEEVD
ncbi:hypothetical protein H072_1165 [Dactylellina haptotyla CBS 200.50]|uniref:Uncharacterized protein n=1 Tax=Dactylellina haptotyla (strain CBS 200.50) TaxID=1284197 RepID=S8BZK7_DACHA|nr:hypothetical protein H072_1165 [Dactylellina haptotyla CBS 200.50]